jgi:hypothetical protein
MYKIALGFEVNKTCLLINPKDSGLFLLKEDNHNLST